MDLTGKVIAIMEARGGVSARTGNPWMTQEYVIEIPGQYPRKMVFNIFGEDKIKQFNIQPGEEITVHNARVYVPAKNGSEFIAAWQPNTKYTYTFKITKDSKGTTAPDTTIDITKPDVPATPTVYPIVFDGATVEDYTEKTNDSNF